MPTRKSFCSSTRLDDNVDVNLVRRYFSHDAWLVVDVIERKKDMDLWICNVCQYELGDNIICESCLEWFHWKCVGVLLASSISLILLLLLIARQPFLTLSFLLPAG